MKEKILKKTSDTFLKYGFKSVTMDDIANDLGISKKTIYKYFKNKEDLVEQGVTHMHQGCVNKVNSVCLKGFNAIQENFEVEKAFKDMFRNADDSPMFQLKKYYPQIFEKVMKNEFLAFRDFIIANIEKGISEGLYHSKIDTNVVARFYFALSMAVHDEDMFTYSKNSIHKLELDTLEYHTRAIATEKGLKILKEQLRLINNNQ